MSDVDAVRWMASEHDLEFVDLDTYGVDPAAGEILPASLSRRHHVVAIKRKFGTPVIATADPDDLAAQETVRDSIGRDFISVVASPDQIGDYLDQLFGPTDKDGPTNGAELGESTVLLARQRSTWSRAGPAADRSRVSSGMRRAPVEPELWSGPGHEALPDAGEDDSSHLDTRTGRRGGIDGKTPSPAHRIQAQGRRACEARRRSRAERGHERRHGHGRSRGPGTRRSSDRGSI